MKPKLSKTQRKALRFAYDLMRGGVYTNFLPYVRGSTLRTPDGGIHFYNRHWIQPDTAEDRPYLNEDIFTILEMNGYMEMRLVPPEAVWLYRITRDGCDALGVKYPLYPPEAKARFKDRFTAHRARQLQERAGLYRRGGIGAGYAGGSRRYDTGYKPPFNYQARKR